MKINNFVLYENNKNDSFAYGTKFIPKRTLNKSTDSMVASIEKYVSGKDTYNISFKKNNSGKTYSNSYSFTKKIFKQYINFLTNFTIDAVNNQSNLEKSFTVEPECEIILSSLDKEHVKICSVKHKQNSLNRIFFTLLKKELLTYINVLENIYEGKEIMSSLGYEMGFLINPLSKKERDELYLSTLYALADGALDGKDKKAFYNISKEIKRILNY